MRKQNKKATALAAIFSLILSLFMPLGSVFAEDQSAPPAAQEFAVNDSVYGVVYGDLYGINNAAYGTLYSGIPFGNEGYYGGVFSSSSTGNSKVYAVDDVTSATYNAHSEISWNENDIKFLFTNPIANTLFEGTPELVSDNGQKSAFVKDGFNYTATISVNSGNKVDFRFASVDDAVYATVYSNVYSITDNGTLTVSFDYNDFKNVLAGNDIAVTFTPYSNVPGNSGSSGSSGDSSTLPSVTPTPEATTIPGTATTPEIIQTATDTEVSFTSDYINNIEAKDNVVTFDLTSISVAKTVYVSLSADQITALEGKAAKTVEIKLAEATLEIPIEVLATGKDIKLEVKKDDITSDDVKKVISDATGNSKNFTAFSMFSFNLTSDDVKVEKFVKPIVVTVNVEDTSTINKAKAGVFNVNGTNVEFAGGKWSGNTVSFKAKHFSDYAVMENDKTFDDIQDNWSKDNIEIIAARMITNGVNDKDFAPLRNVTRAEFAAFIVRTLGLDKVDTTGTFKDVTDDKWYAQEVESAVYAGIVKGNGDGTFAPDQYITREQMAAMIMRAYEQVTGNKSESIAANYTDGSLKDLDKVSAYAVDYVKAANSLGVIEGISSGEFSAKTNAQRDQIAKMIVFLLKSTGEV